MYRVRKIDEKDIDKIAEIYLECFHGMDRFDVVREWIRLKYIGYPINRYYIIEDDKIRGYILWIELGGFRSNAVIELEQVAIANNYQGKGLGSMLIKESLKNVIKEIETRGSRLKLVKVTTGTSNEAQRVYRKVLNAKPVAIIPDLFRGDEVIMIARGNELDLS